MENVVSLIESVRKYQLANNLSEAQGKILARELVRDLRYDKVNYFWIDDFDGINILLPPSPGGEGKSRINLKDVKGKEMVRELIANGRLRRVDILSTGSRVLVKRMQAGKGDTRNLSMLISGL